MKVNQYFEIDVSLKGIRPRIWRRFLLEVSASFEALHLAIQDAMGWKRAHLYQFFAGRPWGSPALTSVPGDDDGGEELPTAAALKLRDVFLSSDGASKTCSYVYDFGDGWEHSVKVRSVVEHQERFHRRLLAGKRSAPPEDCGGVPGYERVVEVVTSGKDPWEDDVQALLQWLGGWEPEGFDLQQATGGFESRGASEASVATGASASMSSLGLADVGTLGDWQREVGMVLMVTMLQRQWRPDVMVEAGQLWASYVQEHNPRKRKAKIWAAAVEYCVVKAGYYDLTQKDVAAAYGVSGMSVSQVYRLIWDAMDLKVTGGGWVKL